jgi:hypothetical protein
MAGHMRIPTTPFFHRHLPQRCFWPDLVRTSPIDHLAFYFPVLALFPIVFCFSPYFSKPHCILFVLPIFWFWFSLYCSFSVCFVCVLFLQFFQSPPCQFCCPPPIARLYSALPRKELQTHLSVVEVCLNAIGFSLYFLFACIWFFLIFLLCFCL